MHTWCTRHVGSGHFTCSKLEVKETQWPARPCPTSPLKCHSHKPIQQEILCNGDLEADPDRTGFFRGCPRTGFFRTDRRMRLGYAISVSGAAPDTLMLTKHLGGRHAWCGALRGRWVGRWAGSGVQMPRTEDVSFSIAVGTQHQDSRVKTSCRE